MLIHASLKIGSRVKSRVIKLEETTLNLRYVKQQPNKVQGRKMDTK
jgi:predicted RNA-binding protein with RPS1 domain